MFTLTKKTLDVNTSWLHSALSSGLQVIEIPFVISFVSKSVDPVANISVFGMALSCLVLASGFLLSLATVTARDGNRQDVWNIFLYALASAIILYFISLIILFKGVATLFAIQGMGSMAMYSIISLLVVAVRRLLQGYFILIKKTKILFYSSVIRVVATGTASVFLPAMIASARSGILLLTLGAVIQVLICCIVYGKYKNCYTSIYENKTVFSIKKYTMLSMASLVYLGQNYLILYILTFLHTTEYVAPWVVIYGFISIFMAIFWDIENITLKYALAIKDFARLLTMPTLIAMGIFFGLFQWDQGKKVYFAYFQGINLRYIPDSSFYGGVIFVIICLFLSKQFLKGIVMIAGRYYGVMIGAIANIFGIILGSFALGKFFAFLEISPTIAYAGAVLCLMGIVAECCCYILVLVTSMLKGR